MPKKTLENLTESMFYVLMSFGRGPMCGIQVTEFIEWRTEGRIKMGPATLYTILGKFEQEGYIQEISVEGRKRTYEITERGLAAYQEEVQRLNQCVADATTELAVLTASKSSGIALQNRSSDVSDSIGSFLGERGPQVCPC